MFCQHQDEEDLIAAVAVPCPLCGYAPDTRRAAPHESAEPAWLEDSHDALQELLARDEEEEDDRASYLIPAQKIW